MQKNHTLLKSYLFSQQHIEREFCVVPREDLVDGIGFDFVREVNGRAEG